MSLKGDVQDLDAIVATLPEAVLADFRAIAADAAPVLARFAPALEAAAARVPRATVERLRNALIYEFLPSFAVGLVAKLKKGTAGPWIEEAITSAPTLRRVLGDVLSAVRGALPAPAAAPVLDPAAVCPRHHVRNCPLCPR